MKNLTRRSFLAGLSAAPLATDWSFASGVEHELLFVGCYTEKGTSQGIYGYRCHAATGALAPLGLAAKTANPSFMAFSPDRKRLYSVNEVGNFEGGKTGSVSAFTVNVASGKLTPKNVVASGGDGPCNISVDHTGRAVFVADFGGGSLASFRVLPGGGLSAAVSNFHFTGHGQDPKRQEASHIHCVTVSPDNRYLVVNDLGLNRILVYHLDAESAILKKNDPPYYEGLPGAGPRNFTFHPNGRWAYSANEMGNSVDALVWDSGRGTLTRFQNISTLPEGFTGSSTAATVVVDSAGLCLYASNRGANTIAVFSIDPANGRLKQVQQISCGGKTPRHFALDRSNRWLLVANQDSGNIVTLARESSTGHLSFTGQQTSLDSPACVLFA